MELKSVSTNNSDASVNVLIVPLWNWNEARNWITIDNQRSNRTFMELKCIICRLAEANPFRSNRTFMELKLE